MACYTSLHTVSLHGMWTLENKADGFRLQTADTDHKPSKKIRTAAAIPGDNVSALLESGCIPNPYYADNEKHSRWIGFDTWVFSREFFVDAKILNYKKVALHMNFVDTHARVYINDKKAGTTSNMFADYEWDVKRYLLQGQNTIRIEIESPIKTASRRKKKLPFPIPATENYPQYLQDAGINTLRKPACHGGWDWGITLMVSGVYGALELRCTDNTKIRHVSHVQKHIRKNNRKRVFVTVRAEVHAVRNRTHDVQFVLEGKGKKHRTVSQILQAGYNTVSCTLEIKNPQLWYPNGYGEQPLYTLSVSTDEGVLCTQKIGLRTIRILNKNDAHGVSFSLKVNDIDVFCKGANWIPPDALPSRQDPKLYRRLLTDTADAHMNMLRVWGGGQYEHEFFYDICDELGILVWHDCMFSCSIFPSEDWFLEEVERELQYQIQRLQHRACIALWCGDNEVLGSLEWYEETRENRDRYLANYVKLNTFIEKLCKTLDPTRVFWPSSPCSGSMGFNDNWHDDSSGDMHYWDVWHSGKSFEAYQDIKPRFCSEFGFQSFPSLPTVQTYASEAHHNLTAPHMEHHQKNKRGNSIILEMFSRYFRIPSDFEHQLYLSQVQQALAISIGVEYWRSTRPVCMGTLYWQLNDNWPVASWSSIDYYGRWKLLHYQIKKSYAPVLLTMRYKNRTLELWAVNDSLTEQKVPSTIRIHNFDGTVVWEKKISKSAGTIQAQSAASLYSLPLKWDETKHFASLTYSDPCAGTREVKTLVFAPYKSCAIEKPHIQCTVAPQGKEHRITLVSDKPAFFVSLEQYSNPGVFTENMVSLLPGEEKTLVFTSRGNSKALSKRQFLAGLRIFHLASR